METPKDDRKPAQSSSGQLFIVGSKTSLNASNGKFLFPKYCSVEACNSNSASAALNKWLKQIAGNDYVIHSFRHSMRDRLRAVGCPSDMIDQIGGWSSGQVGKAYGEGYDTIKLWEYMKIF
jgi:integrase